MKGCLTGLLILAVGCWLVDIALRRPPPADLLPYQAWRDRLLPSTSAKRPPGPSDWLAFNREAGQTLEQYAAKCAKSSGQTIELVPISPFTDHPELVQDVSSALQLQFGLTVNRQATKQLDLPEGSRREHPQYGHQLLTTAIQGRLLEDRRPNSLALLALTEEDLWPGPGWNYVFGQANALGRVGVWSTCRLEDRVPELFLRRTLHTALHETAHLLGLPHCALHECLMNGANSLEEADHQSLVMCGECAPKLWWRFGIAPEVQLKGLIELGRRHHWKDDVALWELQLQALGAPSR